MVSSDKNIRVTDSLRGIFALLIVWHHLASLLNIPYSSDFGNTIVLFFFVLSGYGISLSWKNKIEGSAKAFLIKRCVKIFPIQWLTLILFVLFSINVVTYWAIPFHLTLTQSMVPFWQINYSLNVPSWFLSSLFFCYICTPVLLKYAKNHRTNFVILYVCAVAFFVLFVYYASGFMGLRWLAYLNPGARLLDYSLGMIIGLFWEEISLFMNRLKSHKLTYTIVEIAFIVFMFAFMIYKPLLKFNDFAAIRYPIMAGIIILFSISRGYVSSLLKNSLLQWLGSISMSIYMIQGFILHFSVKMSTYIPTEVNVVLTYTIIIVASYLTEKMLSRYSKHFVGIANKVFK